MKVVIIGCGLIGRKRALALGSDDKLIACCDINKNLSEKFATEFSCQAYTDYHELVTQINCDSVIVAVVNKFASYIVMDALNLGKNVLAEKPLGRDAEEARRILKILEEWNDEIVEKLNNKTLNPPTRKHSNIPVLKTGFNHKFHPAIWKAKQILDQGSIGRVFNIRATYGHGGRPDMENEWRASKELCGGGELLD